RLGHNLSRGSKGFIHHDPSADALGYSYVAAPRLKALIFPAAGKRAEILRFVQDDRVEAPAAPTPLARSRSNPHPRARPISGGAGASSLRVACRVSGARVPRRGCG